ncbi:DUF4124 domain-containing protein [Ramlibacter sp. MMS24-I3-19]|uniref:DUF4124 domain-containing protein n=1 Tax=Ramlibacter sp. MMS24-I3-19 TaxID=3416606 RepID=UPI003D04CAB9
MTAARALTLALACVLPLSAMAQWQWIDKSGHKVYSDQSPPPDIPAKNVLKAPSGRMPAADPAPAAEAPAAASTQAPGVLKVTGRDKELEARKKQAEAAEAEKKKAQDAAMAEAKADNCKRAREAKATLDSGIRLSRVNTQGEREVLDDNQRASEGQRMQDIIARDCA